jgi:hypothetical protein
MRLSRLYYVVSFELDDCNTFVIIITPRTKLHLSRVVEDKLLDSLSKHNERGG